MKKPRFYTSYKMAVFAIVFTLIVFVWLFYFLGINQRDLSYVHSKQIAEEVARKATQETQEYFTSSLMVTRSLVNQGLLYKKMNADRQEIVNLLKSTLISHPGFLSVWTMWDHNSYDGQDHLYIDNPFYDDKGNLSTTFFRLEDTILSEQTQSSDYFEDFYTLPIQAKTEYIIEPYYYQYIGNPTIFYETTVAVPIIHEEQVLGVFAIDIDLKSLQTYISGIRPYSTGFASLMSAKGLIVYHPDSTLISTNFIQSLPPEEYALGEAISSGNEYISETISSFSDEKVFRFFYPIHIGVSPNDWTMMIEIPIGEATQKTKQLVYITSIFATFGIILLLFLFLNILDRRKFDKAVTSALNEAEEKNKLAIISISNYQEIFNSTSEAMLVTCPETGQILDANEAISKMFGFKNTADFLKLTVYDFHKDTKELNPDPVDYFDLTKAKGKQTFEWRSKKRNGKPFWTEITFKTVQLSGENRILVVIRDINESKEALNLLEKSEKRFRELAALLPLSVWETDNNGKFLYVNAKGRELFGYSEEDIQKGIYFSDIMTKESYNDAYEYIQDAFQNGTIREKAKNGISYMAVRKDGSTFPMEIFYNIILSEGKTIGVRGALWDVSARIKNENDLRESKLLFETLASASPVGIFRTDAKGYTTYANPTWSKLAGISSKEAIEGGWISAVHPDDRDLLISKWEESIAKKEKSSAEYRFLHPDGSIVWVLGIALPEISDGVLEGYVGTNTNITEIKIAQQNLKESQERYEIILQALPDIVMVCDRQFRIVYGNEALESILGLKPEDYNNLERTVRIHPEDAEKELNEIDLLMNSDKTRTDVFEVRFFDSKGEMHWFSEIVSKISLNNKTYLQIIARDITERKRIEKELVNYRENLEDLVVERTEELEQALENLHNTQDRLIQAEKMASLGVLTAGIAHEINNPLNFIQGGVTGLRNFLDEKCQKHQAETKPLVDAILEGVSRSTQIVKSLNRYSRKADDPLTPCNIHSIIDSCLLMVNSKITNRITIKKKYHSKTIEILCHEGRIHQAILNILTNAINSIEETGTISITTRLKGNKILVQIADTGYGISPENLSRLADPFFTTNPPGLGTGLGLSITHKIITDHNGHIEFESEVNKGTTVNIFLPKKPTK